MTVLKKQQRNANVVKLSKKMSLTVRHVAENRNPITPAFLLGCVEKQFVDRYVVATMEEVYKIKKLGLAC